jgi:hypothetical protein
MNSRECNEYYVLETAIASLNSKKYDAIKECNKKVYEDTMKYFEKKDKYELLNYIYKNIDKVDTFTNLLENFAQEPGGDVITRQHVFESMCQILLFTKNDIMNFPNDKDFWDSFHKKERIDNLRKLLSNNINEGSTGDSSDIYFEYKDKDKTKSVSISCKYFIKEKSDEKHYDVFKTKGRTNVDEILLFVNNKEKLNELISKKRRDDFSNTKGIYGMTDFEIWYRNLLDNIENFKNLEDFIVKFEVTKNSPLNLRFHQELCSKSIQKYTDEGAAKIIIGAVARSGKSYMIADLIASRKRNALIILGAKRETEDSFYKIFENHSNFDDFEISLYSNKNTINRGKSKKIIIVSQESIKFTKNNRVKRNSHELLKDLTDIDIYYDEIHKGGSTIDAKKTLEALSKEYSPKLFVMITATFTKPLLEYSSLFSNEPIKIFTWSYQDQQDMKVISDSNYESIISNRNIDERVIFKDLIIKYQQKFKNDTFRILREEYTKYPELVLLDSNYLDNPNYNYESLDFKDKDNLKSLLNILKKDFYSKLIGDKVYDQRTPHSEIWFLPVSGTSKKDKTDDTEGIIDKHSDTLRDTLLSHSWFKSKYNVYICNGFTKNEKYKTKDNVFYYRGGNIVEDIENCESESFKDGKSLIILTGNMLTLGVSLKNVTIGINFNSIQSFDRNFQTMFRVLTENPGKDIGVYLDMQPKRSYEIILEYGKIIKGERKILNDNDIRKSLFTFNYNAFSFRKLTFKELSDISKKAIEVINSHKMSRQTNFNSKLKELLIINEEIMNNLESYGLFKYGEERKRKLGRELGKSKGSKSKGSKSKGRQQTKKELEDIDNVTELIRFFIEALSFFNAEYKCDNLYQCVINAIKNVNKFKDICKENCSDDPIACTFISLENITKEQYLNQLKFMKKLLDNEDLREILNAEFSKRMMNIDEKISIKTDKWKKIKYKDLPTIFFTTEEDQSFERIDSFVEKYLPVREKEKNSFGEVMTPSELIIEMLEQLPPEVWSNPNLKWLDPANGTGNFPIYVYYGLMVGLEDEFPDDVQRSEHIIKNMLYMVELNPKNVAVTKKIFGKDCNIYRGSFLPEKKGEEPGWKGKFGIEKFDIIIGNPPFNKGGIRGKGKKQEGTETLWPSFVFDSFNILKDSKSYLLFIHPASWIGLKSENGKKIIEKQILYLRYYNYSEALRIINAKIPLTYYLIQNIEGGKITKIYDNCINKNIKFNIYEDNFIPTESISIFVKLLGFVKRYGNLKSKVFSSKKENDVNVKKTSKYKYPIINISYGKIIKKYSNNNNNQDDSPKLILPNDSMGYPLLDKTGISYPSSGHNFLLKETNIKKLKQIQNYLYTDLVFYLINITKTSQNFLDNKVFEILPDVTQMSKKTNINDNDLISLFSLTEKELKCIENYRNKGEGRLSPEIIEEFKKVEL